MESVGRLSLRRYTGHMARQPMCELKCPEWMGLTADARLPRGGVAEGTNHSSFPRQLANIPTRNFLLAISYP